MRYAAVHQTGGTAESKRLTTDVRKALWTWLKGKGSDYKTQLGWLLNKKFRDQTIKGEVPERPFIGITDRTREFVRRAVGVEIMEVGR